jgi:hypothetical protein
MEVEVMARDSCSHSAILALVAVGAVAWIQPPLHAATARSARWAQSAAHARQEKQSPEELRAQSERDRLEKERLQKQRQEAETARAEALRRRAAQGAPPGTPHAPTRPGAARPPSPAPGASSKTIEERREIAQKAAHFEAQYRSHVARVNRLIGIYKAKGDDAHVTQLERMREKLEVRREHAMEGFRKDLGDAGFQNVQSQVNGKGRRAIEERAKEKDRVPPPKDKAPGEVGGAR